MRSLGLGALIICSVCVASGRQQAEAEDTLSRPAQVAPVQLSAVRPSTVRSSKFRASPFQSSTFRSSTMNRSRSYTTPMRSVYPTRNLSRGRSRLPSGRSYYQGRYYGNLNNRFYGPQYGYF